LLSLGLRDTGGYEGRSDESMAADGEGDVKELKGDKKGH